MISTNQAAWLDGKGKQLRVGPAEMPKAGEGEIVIRNRAIAINPVSRKSTTAINIDGKKLVTDSKQTRSKT